MCDKLWYQIDADGVPGEYKLKDWLADSTVRAMLTSPTVKSLTFKEHMTGPNITRVQAENWWKHTPVRSAREKGALI